MKHVANHEYFYIDYKAMGAYLMELRIQRFDSNRCRFVRFLNENGKYRWDQSAYRKVELGLIELSLDRLIEVCNMLGTTPADVLAHCTH